MNLRDFIRELEERKILKKPKVKLSMNGEIQVLEKEERRAVLLRPKERPNFRFVFNLLNEKEKFALALGTTVDKIHETLNLATSNPIPYEIKRRDVFVEEFEDLRKLPIIQHYEKDLGPYITGSIVTTKNPETGTQNFSIHRLRFLDEKRLVIRIVEGRHLHKIFMSYKERGEALPISICIGVHPLAEISAAYQAPYGVDELTIGNAIRTLNIIESPVNRFAIPECEILIEGEILPDEEAEDQMVEMLGNYDLLRMQPVVRVKKIYCKKDPIYRDILPAGKEHRLLMSLPVEAKLNKLVKDVVPSTKKVVLTDGGCNWLHAVVQISKKVEGEAKNAILAAFSAHPSLKLVIVVDEDIDPENPVSVEYAIATRFQAGEDLIIIRNAKGSSLDPSSDQEMILTDKMGIDATAPLRKGLARFKMAEIFKG